VERVPRQRRKETHVTLLFFLSEPLLQLANFLLEGAQLLRLLVHLPPQCLLVGVLVDVVGRVSFEKARVPEGCEALFVLLLVAAPEFLFIKHDVSVLFYISLTILERSPFLLWVLCHEV
jgi:hypothetical protein